MSRIAVMGAGSWGTTIAKVIADGGSDVILWSRRAEVAQEINEYHRNGDYLPGIDLPANLTATSDVGHALNGATQIYLAVPSQTLRENLEAWSSLIPKDFPGITNVSIESNSPPTSVHANPVTTPTLSS